MATVRPLLVAVAVVLGAAAPAAARPAVVPPAPPLDLPAAGGARAAQSGTWLVGATRGGARLDALAREHGARPLGAGGAHAVPAARARAFAAALRRAGLLRYAEPDRRMRRFQAISEAEARTTGWRSATVPADLVPPPVTAESPLLALLDSAADLDHPEWRQGGGLSVAGQAPVSDFHGTGTASAAGAPANGFGVVGLWPGVRMLNVRTGSTRGVSCADVVRGIAVALERGARVINMSFGGPNVCYAMFEAVSIAVARRTLVVAAAGNDRLTRLRGRENPVMYPAAFPHVVSVASYGPSGATSSFSTSNGAVDVAAPGESIAVAVPPSRDPDGTPDGYANVDGTSFAAPIAAASGAWLMQARPELRADQVASLIRSSARDLGRPGFDAESGRGALDLARALRAPAPVRDVLEINDDVEWVDGTRYTRPDPYVYAGRRAASLTAGIDAWKDPVDVYRVRVPPGRSVRVVLRPQRGTDADVALFAGSARTVYGRRGRIAGSFRGPSRTDAFTARVRGGQRAYVAVYAATRRGRDPAARYTLTLRPAR
jgi:hypothetical protein